MKRNIRHLLLTTSALALIAGINAGAEAACTPEVAPFNNTTTIDCIVVSGTGNIVNTAPGTITNAISGGGTSTAAIQVDRKSVV